LTAAYASLDRSELADATPQLNLLQRLGGSIGTAVLAVVLQRALAGQHTVAGTAFWVSAGLTAFAIIPCVLLLRAELAARAASGKAPPEPLAEASAA
jgi:hypothetical protein